MGLFDNVVGFFDGSTAQNAANQQISGLQQGYNQASGLLDQGRGALTTNFTNALQPLQQNYNQAQGGVTAYGNAMGLNGPAGNAAATAAFQNNPGYQYQLQQGTENELRNQSRMGAVNSGQTQVDLQNIGQGVANQGYNQYVQNLQPYLGQASTAASGIAGVDTGLGTGLNQSYGNQAGLAQTTQTGIGNANANATLAQNSGVANLLGLGTNLAKTAVGAGGLKFADGGRPPLDQPSIVGERGPELFVPDQPGTIIPNDQAGGFASRLSQFMPGQTMTDESQYPVAPGQQYAGDDLAIKLAVQNLRRQMGVSPTPTGNRATDEALRAIDEALKIRPPLPGGK